MSISVWVAAISALISAVALYRAIRADQRATETERQVAQFREEANRPKLAFAGVRFSDKLTTKPEVAKQGSDPAHVNATTRVHNFGRNEAVVTRAKHRIHVGEFTAMPRNKDPDPMMIAPGGVVGFNWDLDRTTWRRASAGEIKVEVRVEIEYMGVGSRAYRYEGRYEYSPEDDQFVCLGESNIP